MITISGTGFSSIAGQNSVTFNGLPATVISSTATEIVTSVPTSATTGPIAVTTPNGSATTNGNFTVTGNTGDPTITSVTPTVGTPGTVVTITGSNFDASPAENRVIFNLTTTWPNAGNTTSLAATVPVATASGPITIVTAQGEAFKQQRLLYSTVALSNR